VPEDVVQDPFGTAGRPQVPITRTAIPRSARSSGPPTAPGRESGPRTFATSNPASDSGQRAAAAPDRAADTDPRTSEVTFGDAIHANGEPIHPGHPGRHEHPRSRQRLLVFSGVIAVVLVGAAAVAAAAGGGPSTTPAAGFAPPSATRSGATAPRNPTIRATPPVLPPRGRLPVPATFPSPSTTGYQHTGVTLRRVDSLVHADRPGAVYDSMDLEGGIEVSANDVTISRSKVTGAGTGPGAGIWIDQGVHGVTITDVEITSHAGANVAVESQIVDRAITADQTSGITISRVYVHRVIRGIEFGYDTTITDSYIDDEVNPSTDHMSAIGGSLAARVRLVVRHTWVALAPNDYDSAALLYYPLTHTPQNVYILLEQNIISGGSYCLWLGSDSGMTGSVTVRDNLFTTKYYPTCGHYNTHFTDHLGSEGNVAIGWDDNVWYAPGDPKNATQITWTIQY
jgi:hypothetical protein